MKKWLLGALVFVCLVGTACDKPAETIPEEDTQESEVIQTQEDETIVPVVEEAEIEKLSFEKVTLSVANGQYQNTDPLYFTEVFGLQKKWENALPSVAGFSDSYVFYQYSDGEIEGNIEDIIGQYSGFSHLGRYSPETGETVQFAIDDMHFGGYSVIANGDCMLYLYHTNDDEGNSVMKIVQFDFAENEQQVIGMYPAYYAVGDAKKLSDNTVVFFFYCSVGEENQQFLLSYDTSTGEIKEIYLGEILEAMHDTDSGIPTIYAMDTFDGNIYLLMQRYVEDRMQYSLRILDETGAVVAEEELDVLSDYGARNDTVYNMVVCGDLLSLRFNNYASEEKPAPAFAFLKKTDNGYQLLDLQGIKPTSSIGKCDNVPYVYFGISGNDNTIYAINYESGDAYTLKLPWEETYSTIVDISGNILVAVREEDTDHWYQIPAENIPFLSNLKRVGKSFFAEDSQLFLFVF